MSEHDPRTFNDVPCPDCGGFLYLPLVRLRHKGGGGLIAEAKGYACLICHKQLDLADALRAYTIQQKREELRSLERELGVDQPQPVLGDENA